MGKGYVEDQVQSCVLNDVSATDGRPFSFSPIPIFSLA